MKVYTATKFSIVIVPPKLSKKTKESKLLVRSFRHIYKVAGLGIATGIFGLLSLSQFKNKTINVNDFTGGDLPSIEESAKSIQSFPIDESIRSLPAPMIAESESRDAAQYSLNVTETMVNSEISVNSDLFLPFLIITVILGGITAYYLWKFKFN